MANPTGRSAELRLLFVARAFPPTVGGMESFALRLSEHLSRRARITTIINYGGKKMLPTFLPYALAQGVRIAKTDGADAIHLADALLAPVGVALRRLTGIPVTASVCGLDVTFPNTLYQRVIPACLEQLDMTMPISEASEHELRVRAPRARITRIPLGVTPPVKNIESSQSFQQLLGERAVGKKIILTVGRLIERKGVAWFVREVMPKLGAEVFYVVIGDGPHRSEIVRAAAESGVRERVMLLGRTSDEVRSAAYYAADAFVMPNIPVAGDLEGFGLVALEAASSGLPVIASRLEGITEAVKQGQNGLLVPPLDADAFAREIQSLFRLSHRDSLRRQFQQFTIREYGWDKVAESYISAIQHLAASRPSLASMTAEA